MQLAVSEFIVRYLERLGVRHIFGMPGAHILPVYDALYRSSQIDAVLVKHEQGAAFMAGGYARSQGNIGACIATAGPGATNLTTGIANAYADNQPVIAITGEAPTHIFGKGGLQESSGEGGAIDQVSLFNGITRYHKLIERTEYLPQVLNRASQVLLAENPGPVLLSIPFDVQKEQVDEALLDLTNARPRQTAPRSHPDAARQLAEMLEQARSPVIVAGYGAISADASDAIRRLSHDLNIPVATSLKGKGAIDEGDPLALGTLGVTSSGIAYQHITEQADLVLFLGASFNERTSYLWDERLIRDKTLIQVDRNPDQLNRVFNADLAIQGDIRTVLEDVLEQLARDHAPAHASPTPLVDESDGGYALFQSGFSLIEYFFQRLAEAIPQGAAIFDDNMIFAQNFYRVSTQNRYHPNSGVSSLGHAIPAAIGARFADQRVTFAILGDGGFQMCCMELMTAVNYDIPLNVVVFNNASMGLIRKNQHQHYQDRYINCDFVNPDFAMLAKSFGINHARVDGRDDVDALFSDDRLHRGINLIEIPIDRDLFPNYSSKR